MKEQAFEGLQFYRCTLCGTVVSRWDIKKHQGCPKCGNTKIKTTDLGLFEKAVQILKHPALWRWEDAGK